MGLFSRCITRAVPGIWSKSVILRWLPWLSELRGAKSNSNRRATKRNSSISSRFLIALRRLRIPRPAVSTKKPKRAIEEGISLTGKRIKVIKLADRSEFGWSTVSEYLSDDLASNSEDEKRIFRSERRAECRSKLAASRRKISASGARSSPVRSASTSGLHLRNSPSRIGPCYK